MRWMVARKGLGDGGSAVKKDGNMKRMPRSVCSRHLFFDLCRCKILNAASGMSLSLLGAIQ